MRKHDSLDTLHYVDPPYVHTTRSENASRKAYKYEMTEADHCALATTLLSLRGMVLLSGYYTRLYAELYKDWYKVKKRTYADGARQRVEYLWLNAAAVKRLRPPAPGVGL